MVRRSNSAKRVRVTKRPLRRSLNLREFPKRLNLLLRLLSLPPKATKMLQRSPKPASEATNPPQRSKPTSKAVDGPSSNRLLGGLVLKALFQVGTTKPTSDGKEAFLQCFPEASIQGETVFTEPDAGDNISDYNPRRLLRRRRTSRP